MADTDILLTVDLDTTDAYKQANQLQKEVENIFKSRKGAQSSTLTSIELQMKKIYDQSNKIKSSMKQMLDIHTDYSDITSQFSILGQKAEELESKLEFFDGDPEGASKMEEELDQIYNDMAALIPKMEELEQSQLPTEEFAKLQAEYSRLNSEIEKGEGNYNDLINELDRITDKMNKMRAEGTSVISPEGLDEFKANESKLDGYNDKLKQLVIRYNEVKTRLEEKLNPPTEDLEEFEGELENVGDTGKKTSSRLSGVLNLLKAAIDKVKTGVKKLLGHFISIRRTTSGPSNPFKSLINSLLRIGLGISTLFVLWNKLRAGVREGFSNLYKDNKKFKKSVDDLKNALTTFKNSLAAAFQPIVTMAIPYIQRLVEWMTSLMEQVAKFSAAITGQKYYMRAIKQTGNAAEQAQKQLAGFDKLNVLNQQDGGQGKMFEEVPLQNAEELLSTLKDMFSLKGLYNMGKTFAQKINEFLESIQWDKIKQKAAEIGKKLATLLNGWIDNLHWENIGSTLAEVFNTIFNFLYDFVSTLHWGNIGKGIADAIMSFFETTDFNKIADTLAEAINGMIKLVKNLLKYTNFKEIGTKIGNFLNRAFKRIKWGALGEDLKNLIVGLADIVINLMRAVDWEDVGNKIGEFLKEFFEGDPNPLEKVGEALWEALKAAVKVLSGIGEENPIAAIIIGGLIAAKTIALFSAAGKALGLALNGGVAAGVAGKAAGGIAAAGAGGAAAAGGIGAAIATAFTTDIGLVLGAGTATEIGLLIGGGILGGVAAALGGFAIGKAINDNFFSPLEDAIESWIDKEVAEDAAEWADHTADVATTAWNSGLEAAAKELDWTWLTDAMDVEGHDEAWDKLVVDVEDGIRRMNAAGVDLSDTAAVLEYIGNPLKAGWLDSNTKQYIQMLSEDWDNLSTSTQNALLGIEQVSETQSRALQASEAAAKEYAQSMSDTYNSTIDGMIEDTATQTNSLTTLYSSLKDNLTSIFNSIIGGSEGMSNGVTEGINQVSDSLNSMSFTIPDWIPGVGGKSLSFNLPRLGKISIPKLAQGAVIPANNEFLAVLGDQKQGTNVEAPLDTIKQALAEVMVQMGGSSDNSDIVINIDGDEVFRVIRDKDKVFKKSTGKSAFA